MAPPAPLSLKVDRSAKTLRELALETMRTAIINGHFQAGERLVERTLCEKLDVSRSIVREVLRHLETEGLITSVGHQGPVVSSLSLAQAVEIYEIRALLEGHAASMFTQRAKDKDLVTLNALNTKIQKAIGKNDLSQAVTYTTAFYETLFAGANVPVAWEIVKSLNARINRLRLMTIGTPGREKQVAVEMEKILSALSQRDALAAQTAAVEHVQRVSEIAIRILQK
jgi:DNA-binding GntR family transcriptional regulator